MFVENKKAIVVGNSIAITLKSNAGIMLQKGDEVKVTYNNKKITIERVK